MWMLFAVRERRPAPEQIREKGRRVAEEGGAGVKANKKQNKAHKPAALSLDSLNLLHTHTLLSTMGQGETFCPVVPSPSSHSGLSYTVSVPSPGYHKGT